MSLPLVSAYVAGWTVVIGTFAFCYNKRKQKSLIAARSWFPEHSTREHYYALLEADPPAEEVALKAALLRRAMTDVQRIWSLREERTSLQSLVKTGTVGDDLWIQFQDAEKELEAEIMEIVKEADTFRQGWGQQIFQQASDMVQHELQKEQRAEAEKVRAHEEKERIKREEREKAEAPAREAAEKLRKEKEAEKAAEELLREEKAAKDQAAKLTSAGKKKENAKKK